MSASTLALGRQSAARAGSADQAVEIEGLLAGGEIFGQPVLETVELVAGGDDLARDQSGVVRCDRLADVGIGLDEGLRVPGVLDRRPRQVEAGIADEEAVIGFRHPRRRHHRVATAVRTAEHVGISGLAAVMRGDDRLGDRRERHVGRIAVVAPRLRIEAEGRAGGEAERLVGRIGAGMSAVRRHDRKAARQRRHAAGSERLRLVAGRGSTTPSLPPLA